MEERDLSDASRFFHPTRRTVAAGLAAFAAAGLAGVRPARAAFADDVAALAPALAELADEHRVPGLALALFDGDAIATVTAGVRRAGEAAPVTGSTVFQACSISKTLAAVTTIAVVQTGAVDLDADVRQYLRSWTLPPDRFGGRAVTLRRLLGMTAGIGVPGFPGYAPGAPLPSLREILDGTPPANTPAVTIVQAPGRGHLYSGGGYEIVEAVLADAVGIPYGRLVPGLVIGPARMSGSTLDQPLVVSREPDLASGHLVDGTPLAPGAQVMPELAAAGLWSTPADLARLAVALCDALAGAPRPLLRPDLVRQMLTPVDGTGYGLGGAVSGTADALIFHKGGHNLGFHCHLVVAPALRRGGAVMTNSENGEALIARLLPLLATRYAWPPLPDLAE
jgi:CubicO group peptidase (beta-lactamase class C family)